MTYTIPKETLQALNAQAYETYSALFRDGDWQQVDRAMRHVAHTALALIAVAEEGDKINTPDGPMFVARARFEGVGTYVLLSQDGRTVDRTAWHKPADGSHGEWVAYEAYRDGKRDGHGFCDSVSRKILQSG